MSDNVNAPNGRVYSPSGERSMTKQSDALMSDVNGIVARHVAHKVPLPEGTRFSYGDFGGISDFHEACNRVEEAERSFLALPASVRKHCHNDPGEFLDLVYDPERREELVKLGLLPGQLPADAVEAPPVADRVVPVEDNV